MTVYHKLELVWPGKDDMACPEPRILLEKERYKSSKQGISDNLLIHADNLLGLKALEKDFAGKVKCIYIDPPYNTKSCFTHYDDSMEHSMWLNMMKERLVFLHRLLRKDGTILISIDDDECHYLKVLCDEIFGRRNFLTSIVWNHSIQTKGYKKTFSVSHNYILVYQKTTDFALNSAPRLKKDNHQYTNPDNDPRGLWCKGPVANSLYRKNLIFDVETPSGKTIQPPANGWRWSKATLYSKISRGEIGFNADETGIFRKIYLADQDGKSPSTFWPGQDMGTTREATAEVRKLLGHNGFCTPKPERLIARILHLATATGDLVLDCFAGSGTTGAVAHKMGRRWIMIEMGDHAMTHIIPRLEMVIEGKDPGGVTESTGWHGGGGFRFCEIAQSD